MTFLCFFTLLFGLTFSSATFSTIEFVNSDIYANLTGIGNFTNALPPEDYLALHHLINFRPLWKIWCKTLNTQEKYTAAQKELGEHFWKIVDGECLFLGPLSWMTKEDIQGVACPPLHNVPFSADTRNYVIPTQDLLRTLIDRTLTLSGFDTLGFLSRNPENLKLTLEYFKNLVWDHPHWNILSPFFTFSMYLEDYSKVALILKGMLPPGNITVTSENILLIQERIIMFLGHCQVKYFDSIMSKDHLAAWYREIITNLGAHSSLASFVTFIKYRELDDAQGLEIFKRVGVKNPYIRLWWIWQNSTNLDSKTPQGDQLRAWLSSFPTLHPNLPIFSSIISYRDASVPAYFNKLADDIVFSRDFVYVLFNVYSEKEAKNFLRWYLRTPPSTNFQRVDSSCVLFFGAVNQEKQSTASLNQFKALLMHFQQHPNSKEAKSIFLMSLAYGFPLTDLTESGKEELIRNLKPLAFSDFPPAKHPLLDGINRFLEPSNFPSFIINDVIRSPPTPELALPGNPEIVQRIKMCNNTVDKLGEAERGLFTPRLLSLYLREGKYPPDFVPEHVKQIRDSILNSPNQMLNNIFQSKSDSESDQMLKTLREVYNEDQMKVILPKITVVKANSADSNSQDNNVKSTKLDDHSVPLAFHAQDKKSTKPGSHSSSQETGTKDTKSPSGDNQVSSKETHSSPNDLKPKIDNDPAESPQQTSSTDDTETESNNILLYVAIIISLVTISSGVLVAGVIIRIRKKGARADSKIQ